MDKPYLKKLVRLSWIRKQATDEFEALKHDAQLDSAFFTNEELEHYIQVLIMSHTNDWMVINDIEDEGTV